MAKPTAKSCQIVSAPSAQASGIERSAIALPTSLQIRIGRRGRRSTHTPAGSVKRRKGRNSIAPRAATSNALASSARIAARRIASCEMCEPS
jgi:hypothetical protein